MVNTVKDSPVYKKNKKILFITHKPENHASMVRLAIEKDLILILEKPIKLVSYSEDKEQWMKKDDDQIRKRVTNIITKEQDTREPLYIIYLEANLGKNNAETAFSAEYLREIKAAVVLFNGSNIEKSQTDHWKEIRQCKNVIAICDHKDLFTLWKNDYESCKFRYESWKK